MCLLVKVFVGLFMTNKPIHFTKKTHQTPHYTLTHNILTFSLSFYIGVVWNPNLWVPHLFIGKYVVPGTNIFLLFIFKLTILTILF